MSEGKRGSAEEIAVRITAEALTSKHPTQVIAAALTAYRNEALDRAAELVIVGAGGFEMSYMECAESIRELKHEPDGAGSSE